MVLWCLSHTVAGKVNRTQKRIAVLAAASDLQLLVRVALGTLQRCGITCAALQRVQHGS